jgi:hypothetical protein
MEKNTFIDKLIGKLGAVPPQAEVLELKHPNVFELHRRTRQLLSIIGQTSGCNYERGDWSVQHDNTLVRLPMGANAVVYHASGAMRLNTGLAPMEQLFEKMESKEHLIKLVEQTARKLNFQQWVGESEQLKFERLWQIKAAAADRKGETISPILCRAVGAYRHFIGELPVLGAASVAVKVASHGQLDSLSILTRPTSGKILDTVKTISPEQAVDRAFKQLGRLMGNGKMPLSEAAIPQTIQFGYLNLAKRKAQRLLEPAYVITVSIEGQQEAQGYLFAISGTENPYMPLSLLGEEALAVPQTRQARYGFVEEREQPLAAC